MIHVAIVLPVYAEAIASGRKTIEARLTRNRIAPFGTVAVGDRIYFKKCSGPFVITALAAEVEQIEGLTPRGVLNLRRRFNERVLGSPEYWHGKSIARYATLVTVTEVETIAYGPDYRADPGWRPRSAWMALKDQACVYPACLGESLTGDARPKTFIRPSRDDERTERSLRSSARPVARR